LSRRGVRIGCQVAAVVLIVAIARWLCYALAPSPDAELAAQLQGDGGGASLVWVSLAFTLAPALAAALGFGLVASGVRERARLGLEGWSQPGSLGLATLARRAATLALASSLTFAGFESWIHYREGLGFHGLSCLAGPVHRNALPILLGLSILIAAALAAIDLVLAALAGRVLAATAPRPQLRPAIAAWPRALALCRSGTALWATAWQRPPPA
jgi:hypothetical protein